MCETVIENILFVNININDSLNRIATVFQIIRNVLLFTIEMELATTQPRITESTTKPQIRPSYLDVPLPLISLTT